jgi:hypothetical protein
MRKLSPSITRSGHMTPSRHACANVREVRRSEEGIRCTRHDRPEQRKYKTNSESNMSEPLHQYFKVCSRSDAAAGETAKVQETPASF